MKIIFLIILIIMISGCGSSSSDESQQEDKLLNDSEDNLSFRSVIDENFSYYDQSLWIKSDWANGSPFYNSFSPEQVDISSNLLTITLEEISTHGKTHSSGEYRTLNSYKYGRYSSRFKASSITGTISSFFTYTGENEGTSWDEIDIEILGKDTTKVQLNYWRDGHEHPHFIDLGFDASLDMHDYSFVFTQDYIKWYVDNKEIYSVYENNLSNNDSLPVNGGRIIVNLWASDGSIDNWSGHYEDNQTAKAIYEYIKFEELE